MPLPPKAARVAQNLQLLKSKLRAHKLPDSVLEGLAKRANPSRVVNRINALKNAGVPLKGIVFKTSLSRTQFQALIDRYTTGGRLTDAQREVFELLVKGMVPKSQALAIAQKRNSIQMKIPEKLAYFRGIVLDPNRYGVSRLPVQSYVHLLTKPLEEIQRGIKKQVLWKVEDAHAKKVLDAHLPNWRNVRILFPPGKKPRRPAEILAKIRDFEKQGIPLRSDYLHGSRERAIQKFRSKRGKTRSYKKLLAGTKFDPVVQRAKARRVEQIEEELARINDMIKSRDVLNVDYRNDLEPLLARRNLLVKERNQLLV